jgi:hypothetical protein
MQVLPALQAPAAGQGSHQWVGLLCQHMQRRSAAYPGPGGGGQAASLAPANAPAREGHPHGHHEWQQHANQAHLLDPAAD